MRSPVSMNCCSPQQEALLFSSSGSSTFGCLCMLGLFLVHRFRVKLKRVLLHLLACTKAVCQAVAVLLATPATGVDTGR